jgi:hypothetical protein
MPTIEERALALVNEVAGFDYLIAGDVMDDDRDYMLKALCRALEAHDATLAEFEAFRRKVSDKAEVVKKLHPTAACYLGDLILPKPVDPLVEAVRDCGYATLDAIEPEFVADLRAALAKRGLKLVEVGDAD